MKLRHRFITAASVLALAGAGMRADAQIIMSYAVDSPQLSFIWQNTDKFDVLDSAYLTVTYSLRYRSPEQRGPDGPPDGTRVQCLLQP